MNMKIGEIIKKLRKDRDVTQETLADYLGITYQAVSKWENGTALPDITLVVPLANFFGVSADELFSLNEQITNDKIKEYEEKYKKYFHIGDLQNCINLMREALAEYPKNFNFMINLAYALPNINGVDRKKEEVINEIINLCERILEDCTDDGIRQSAIQLLCFNYPCVGKRDRAIELAKKMPTMCLCSGMLLDSLYEGEERIKTIQRNLLEHIDWACMDLNSLSRQNDLTLDEKILCIETSIKLYEAIYYDGNLQFYHCRLAWDYYNLATHYIQKDSDTALNHLLEAEKNAETYDKIVEQDLPYTSIFVNRHTNAPSGISKNWIGTESGMLFDRLDEKCFDSIRDNPEFTALKERLTARQK